MDVEKLADGTMAYRIDPAGMPPAAAVLFAHGFAESAPRHVATLTSFAEAGFAAYAFDLPGHGRSPGARGFVRRFDDVLRAMALLRARIAERYPQVPLILMGYSLGGLAALRAAQRDPAPVAGVVLVAAGLGVASHVPPVVRRIGVAFGEIAPHVPVARLRLRNLRPEDGNAPGGLLDLLLPRDPLVPARTAAEAMRASHAAFAAAASWRTPTLFVNGEADRVVPLASARRFVALARNAETTLDLVAGAHHDLLRGRHAEAVRATIVAWIRAHLSAS